MQNRKMEPVSGSPASTAERYRAFAEIEAPGLSAIFEEWALGVANDPDLIRLIDELPSPKRQPILVFAAARAAGAPLGGYSIVRAWLLDNWSAVRAIAEVRSTQTNEPARCAVLLPILAALPGPLALLEVGASAGLCLLPDRYSYRYGDTHLDPDDGVSSVILQPRIAGAVPVPERMPEIVWRAGIDLNPLNVFDEADATWLETLVWPEHTERLARLRASLDIARSDPPRVIRGDAIDSLQAVAAEAPAGATLVVFHSAVLAYFAPDDRTRFVEKVTGLPGHWISCEGQKILPTTAPNDGVDPALFAVNLDGTTLAYAGGHGQSLQWIGPAS